MNARRMFGGVASECEQCSPEHTHADHATYATFSEGSWRGWKVASFRAWLRAWSACYGVVV
ncbi:MAG: hypothetical protein HY741_12485 [Chloroflexi bacterium]|nr:hypothetical protein [Chloroflexota bacterium]